MKRKIAFALLMGMVTTGIISFTVIVFNVGMVPGLLLIWLKSWLIAYVIAVPLILIVAPRVEKLVNFLFNEKVLP